MTIATEKIAETFYNVQNNVAVNCPFPLFAGAEVEIVYGFDSLTAIINVDYTITLSPPNYNQFTVTPKQPLITKINNLISISPLTEINYITVRRKMDLLTSSTPATIGETAYLSSEIDRIHMRLIQLAEMVKRGIAFPRKSIGDDSAGHYIKGTPVPNGLVAWSPDGSGLTNAVISGNLGDITQVLTAIAAVDTKATKAIQGIESDSSGFLPYILSPTEGVPTSQLSGNLSYTTPAVVALVGGFRVNAPAISAVIPASTRRDYYLNADGSWSLAEEPIASYPEIQRYPDKLFVWTVESGATKVERIALVGNTVKSKRRYDDKSGSIDRLVELYYIRDNTIAWAANTAVTQYGVLIETAEGRVYQVVTPGTTGAVAPTGIQTGDLPIVNGTVELLFYATKDYLGMFRYGINNGIEYYFSNLGVHDIVHRSVLQTNPLSVPAGTTIMSLAEKHIKGVYRHLIRARVNSGTYKFGMKFTQSGFIWRVISVATGAAAANTAGYTGTITAGNVRNDGALQVQAIAVHYTPHNHFWYNVDQTFINHRYPDSHDSYASTLTSLHAQMLRCGYNLSSFLGSSSEQPTGSGTFATYRQLMDSVIYDNLTNQMSNNLTRTFQSDIAPWNGGIFNLQYLEDNCESAKGFRDAGYIYNALGAAALRDTALANYDAVDLVGIALLYDVDYKRYATNRGQDVSQWDQYPGWYPYGQAQFFPERCNLRSAHGGIRYDVRQSVFAMFPNWFNDRSRSTFPDNFIGVLAAGEWQDIEKAYKFVEDTERNYIPTNSLTLGEYAWYLLTKDILVPPFSLLNVESNGITVRRPGGDIEKIAV
jgi:hypothetical protein